MIREAVEHCSPADFRDPNLGGVWALMIGMRSAGDKVDPITVDARIREEGTIRGYDAPALRAHAEEKDRTAKNWNGAFTRWLINAAEYAQRDGRPQLRSVRPAPTRPLLPGDPGWDDLTDDQKIANIERANRMEAAR